MNGEHTLGLFQGYGVELEYMIVDRQTLAVLPLADRLLRDDRGEVVNEVEHGLLNWSNELVLHVIELKTNGPVSAWDGLAGEFTRQCREINRRLSPYHGLLMPSAMHPWMDPDIETRIWSYGDQTIYATYDRIFGCRGHGWSNLQSAHLNLPFANDEEFGRLHAAIRLVLPLLPAVAASSPVINGRMTGLLDNRIDAYRLNQIKIPSITGQIIPEAVFTQKSYEEALLNKLYQDIASYDPEGILQMEWLNSRGAIARFERNTIEIRLLDVQETPYADVAIMALLVETIRKLVTETHKSWLEQQMWPETTLADILFKVLREGRSATIDNPLYLEMFGVQASHLSVRELWSHLIDSSENLSKEHVRVLSTINREGPLARRLVNALGDDPDRDQLAAVYRELCDCLEEGRLFHV